MDIRRSSKDFAAIGYFLMKGGAGLQDALEHAEQSNNPRAVQVLKAAVNAGTLMSPGWAGSASGVAEAQSAFLATLRGVSIFDTLLPDMVRVPNVPTMIRVNTQAIVGVTTGEARARPITRLQFVTADWPLFNSQAIVVLSDSVMEMFEQEAIDLVERELRAGVVAATDAQFLAQLASGITPIASTGSTAGNLLADLITALDRLQPTVDSRVYVIAPSRVVRRWALRADTAGAPIFPNLAVGGGTVQGIRVLVSDNLPAGVASPAFPSVLVVDAARVAAASDGIGLDRATHASVQMDDAPTMAGAGTGGSPNAPTATNVVSLWQANLVGLRAQRWWRARRLADTAVAVISGVES
jgi:hypothetical protein